MAEISAEKIQNSYSRRDRFVRIAERRVNKILDSLYLY